MHTVLCSLPPFSQIPITRHQCRKKYPKSIGEQRRDTIPKELRLQPSIMLQTLLTLFFYPLSFDLLLKHVISPRLRKINM